DQRGKIAISPFGNPHREMLSGNRCQACYIVDGTAGFGQDAWLFAQCGCRVELVERNPAMVMLLEDAIARADIETMQVVWADAKEHLSSLKQQSDVVYLDPMFPERKKSALVKRNMQALQLLADAPQDEAALLDAALIAATKRVVVKRPKWADPLPGPAPSFNVETKGYRFDVYVCAANASG
ncbi:MAG: 16S rRNA methyltransferase, partial [Legionellales bacterium]|nr:16S rRNA methyltransferase [Legionellales bacterium]